MGKILDLLFGRPRVRLSPSLLLGGEVTTPYGQEPSPDAILSVWQDRAGDRPIPPWILLGPRDTPNGTVWRFAWCPPTCELPPNTEIVLPCAAWVMEILSEATGPSDWHSRLLSSPDGYWIGLWEGVRCERILGPFPSKELAWKRLAEHARKAEIEPGAQVTCKWVAPDAAALRRTADTRPESDLLPPAESLHRAQSRADWTAVTRTGTVVGLLCSISLGLGVWQLAERRSRLLEETRLASVRPLLERVSVLRRSREALLDSLRSHRDAMAPNSSLDRILSGIARTVPEGAKLQVLQLESAGAGWKARTEARLASWDQVQPFAQALRAANGVDQVAVVSQNRSDEGVQAVFELKGKWP